GFLSNRALRFLPHRMHVVNKTLLSCAIGAALLACPLFAQADDDRFTLRLGAMQAGAESRFSADAEFGGEAYAYESGRYTLGDRTVPRAEGMFRIGDRHRLLFNYFRYAQDRDYALGQDLVLGDTTIPAGTTARSTRSSTWAAWSTTSPWSSRPPPASACSSARSARSWPPRSRSTAPTAGSPRASPR